MISAECAAAPPLTHIVDPDDLPAWDDTAELLYQFLPAALAYGCVSANSPLAALLARIGVTSAELDWFLAHAELPDLFGFNYYPAVAGGQAEVAGTALLQKLQAIHAAFGLPVYIAETSAGMSGEEKGEWMRQLGLLFNAARERGLPLRGVNWWPLYETIQWDYRDNGKSVEECIVPGGWNNGLYVIDKTSATLERVPTRAVAISGNCRGHC